MDDFKPERSIQIAIAAVFGVVLAAVVLRPFWLYTEVAAAWAQAVMSVAAISVSAGLWYSDRRRLAETARQRQAVTDFKVASSCLQPIAALAELARRLMVSAEVAKLNADANGTMTFDPRAHALSTAAQIQIHAEGCSPALEADLLAIASFARRYAVEVERRCGMRRDEAGQSIPWMTTRNWAEIEPLLISCQSRAHQVAERFRELLKTPPNFAN